MDLFSQHSEDVNQTRGPLASRMRPQTLQEFIGQSHIIGEGKLLRRAIMADQLTPMIFFGPPGTGKTTLAKVIANTTSAYFEQLNAVTSGVADLKRVTSEAKERLIMETQKTVLFIDEIHRFNKNQQDALLPFVEDGTVVLIGATTESPMFEINPALLSRSRLFRFEPLGEADISLLIERTLHNKERGYGKYNVVLDEDAKQHLVTVANGDVRTALNALELAVLTTTPNSDDESIHITLAIAEESIQQRVLQYDKKGDNHYDTTSAFIKSIRGSDPDAALYWLAKMIYAGEDPRFIARRIYVHAAEDIGLADPNALLVAQAAAYAVDFVGMPEARIPLAEAVVYLATAPKSNSVIKGIDTALAAVSKEKSGQVPIHLRDAHYKGAKELGHGLDYQYPHDFQDGYVVQQYLPDHLRNKTFYEPSPRGFEKSIQNRLHYFMERKRKNR
ncbi:recombination factor protein RarA [Fictibacillus macauensis ZFHKF-1]|uniref:Replication-associated recombination protein A n=1 Tax=Fictibacillus macauensis ZFHKF-1 TaxID=1196324 RepID=I8J0L8_9BACL|nr:AAA family ATPase [Fictibacillus macauensis]EIT85301.1 recombination factor protein RarA [Fictibacillus macauensis ZFHKF-1]